MNLNQSEKILWKSLKKGDREARNTLIEKYTPLVKYVAGRVKMIVPPQIEFDDLVSFGILGLIQAIDRFNLDQGIKFSTFASVRIRGSIIDGLRSQDWISRSGRDKAKKLNAVYRKLEQSLCRTPEDEELARELGLNMEEYYQFVLNSNIPDLTSLDIFVDHESDIQLIDMIPDQTDGPEQILSDKELKDVLAKAIDRLNQQEQFVLALYYYEELTQMEIAEVMDVSPARVSQIHSRAVLRLRGMLSRKKALFL